MAKHTPLTPHRPEVLAFLNDCKDNPEDDTPRLVLADWLEDHGDERGEFVRLQCLRSRGEGGASAHAGSAGREAELLRRHREAWLGVLAEGGIFTRTWRGLVDASASTRKLLGKRLASVRDYEALAWVDRLLLHDFKADDLKRLAASPHWQRLTALEIGSLTYHADSLADPAAVGRGRGDWTGLASLSVLGGLTELDVSCQDIGAEGVSALAALPDLGRLRVLSLGGNNLGDTGAAALAACRSLTGLTRLDLQQNRMRADAFAALAGWSGLATVDTLYLGDNYPGPQGVGALAASPWLGALTSLRLGGDELSLPPSFGPRSFGPLGVAALAGARGLTRLRQLHLSGNEIGPEGAEILAGSQAFPALDGLDLSDNQIGDAGAIALATAPSLQGLTRLDLRYNGIGDRGAVALASSPYLGSLTYLGFQANHDTTPRGRAALLDRFGSAVDDSRTISAAPASAAGVLEGVLQEGWAAGRRLARRGAWVSRGSWRSLRAGRGRIEGARRPGHLRGVSRLDGPDRDRRPILLSPSP